MSTTRPRPARAPSRPLPLPRVVINMAVSADGKIATANRAVSSFGSPQDQAHLYALRARADAVLCGARTVDTEPVDLGPGPLRFRRLRRRLGKSAAPLRVVVSGRGSLKASAHLFSRRFSPILLLTTQSALARRPGLAALADAVGAFGRRALDLRAALAWLRRCWGVRRLVCEGGATLNAALLRAGLVAEVHLTVCPYLLGGRTAPTFADGADGLALAQALGCRLRRARLRGREQFLEFLVLPVQALRPSRARSSGPKAKANRPGD